MNRRIWVCMAVLGVLVGSLAWAGGAAEDPDGAMQPVTLRYAHMNTEASIMGLQTTAFAEAVKDVTDGRVTVEVYPHSQLGSNQAQLEMTVSGAVAFHHTPWGQLSSLIPDFAVFNIPYLTRSVEDMARLTDINTSPVMQRLNERLIAEQGLRIIAVAALGNERMLTTRDIPYSEPADLAGELIRAIPIPVFITAVKGLGGIPTPIDFADLPTALATGTVQGQENPPETIRNAQMYETQNYLALTAHIQGSVPILVNEEAWLSFTEEEQEDIRRVAQEVAAEHNQMTIDNAADTLQYLRDQGMTIIGPDEGLRLDLIIENTERYVREEFGEEFGDLLDEVKDYLGY